MISAAIELRESRSGSKDLQGRRTYTRVWLVTTTTTDDGPQTILKSSLLPKIGDSYSVGNDRDLYAIVEKITPTRLKEKPLYWEVTFEYATQTGSGDQSDPGNPNLGGGPDQMDPEEVELSYSIYTKPASTGLRYINGIPSNSWGAITNSAKQPFVDPPIEIDDSRPVIRISRNLKSINEQEASDLVNSINSRPFKFTWKGMVVNHGRHEVKLASLTAGRRFAANTWYWRVNYEFEIGDWYARPLDMGLSASGLDDIGGSAYSPSDVVYGKCDLKVLKDVDDIPIPEPALLDGNGMPLVADANATNAVFLQYQVYEAKNWGANDITRKLPRNLI